MFSKSERKDGLLGNVLFPIIFSVKGRVPDKQSNKIPLVYL